MKRLIAYVLFVCLVFTMNGCRTPVTPVNTEPATEATEATEPNNELQWKARRTATATIESELMKIELMTYESAKGLPDYSDRYGFEHFTYDKDYFKNNSLILVQFSNGISFDYFTPIDEVRTDGDQLILVRKIKKSNNDSPQKGTTVLAANRIDATFIEVYDFIPKSTEVKLIYEYEQPPKYIATGIAEYRFELTKEESEAMPQFQYLDYETASALIEAFYAAGKGSDWSNPKPLERSLFNTNDLILIQAVTGAGDDYCQFHRIESEGDNITAHFTRYAEPTDVATGENTRYYCFLVFTRCYRPQITELNVEYYTFPAQ